MSRLSRITSFLFAAFVLGMFVPQLSWATAFKRKVVLSWRAAPSINEYELQLGTDPTMETIVKQGIFKGLETSVSLAPGTYYMRVRGLLSGGSRGPWTDAEGFVVNTKPPTTIEPAAERRFSTELPDEGILFRWSSGLLGSKYLIEIQDDDGASTERGTTEPRFSWKPNKPGHYRWRVGFETTARKEWGHFSAFSVEKGAFPPDKVITLIREVPEGIPDVREPSWTLMARSGGFMERYSGQSPSSLASGSGTTVNAAGSVELRWEGVKAAGTQWVYQGGVEGEILAESAFGISKTLPRGKLRFGAARDDSRFAWGPVAEVSARAMNVVILGPSDPSPSVEIPRFGLGGGLGASYRLSRPFSLATFGLGRADIGGSSSLLGGSVASSPGYEFGFSSTYETHSGFLASFRLRVFHESLEWQESAGQASISDLLVTFDLGLGLRF